jgi:integrase
LKAIFLPWCDEHEIGRPEQLTQRALDSFSVSLLARKARDGRALSKFSVHAYARAVRGFLGWCSKEGEGTEGRPSLPRLPRRVLDVLSRDEIAALESGAATERDRIIIRTLGDCGLRASELCALHPSDVVRHDRQAYLRVQGKGERERLVPLPPALLRRIDRYVRETRPDTPHPNLFVSNRRGRSGEYEPLTRSGLLQLMDAAAQRAGLSSKRVHPHLLRHSFITNALRAGMNPLVLSRIAGHSSLRMIEQVYSHLNAGDSYDAMIRALGTTPSQR